MTDRLTGYATENVEPVPSGEQALGRVFMGTLPEVAGEGRWVLMSEAVLMAWVEHHNAEHGAGLEVVWGQPDTRLVTFSSPSITRIQA